MLHSLRNYCGAHYRFVSCVRHLTTTEVSTALRPFYFAVHPDLFGQHPSQRIINENSLKQLNMLIETLQSKRTIKPTHLQFYIRNKDNREGGFRLIKIHLKDRDVREAVLTILKTCALSTEYIEKIPKRTPPPSVPPRPQFKPDIDLRDDPIFGPIFSQQIHEARNAVRLSTWLADKHKLALEMDEANRPLRQEVHRLKLSISDQLKLQDIRWDCGWNVTHFRGCLQSFISLAEQHPEIVHFLRGRTVVFAPFTGISLDGHIMLNSGEIRHNWLDLIKNVRKYDAHLIRIPGFEKSVSQVLRGIKVGRRKFMPKILAGEYERNLQQVTTSLSDYLGTRGFPKQWPETLENHEIVVETEAGPVMVSPTGQFIVPSSLPGYLLVCFISQHLEEAKTKGRNYEHDKHVERSLHKQCVDTFNLSFLRKDDNVTPDLMIKCCERLLEKFHALSPLMNNLHLNIATYYSVLYDGVVCIPWNWKL